MKKRLIIILVLIVLFLIVTLNIINSNRTIKCTYNNKTDIYEINTTYIIKHKKDKVLELNTKEIIKSNDNKLLDDYKFSLETLYNKYNNLKYYDNSIYLKDNTLTTITNINYEKIDLNEFKKIDSNINSLMKNNNISLKKLKQTYQNNGAKCIYK